MESPQPINNVLEFFQQKQQLKVSDRILKYKFVILSLNECYISNLESSSLSLSINVITALASIS